MNKLTEQQHTSITLLLAGQSQRATADDLGINPATVFRWLQEPVYLAELRARRLDAHQAAIEKIRSLAMRAIAIVEDGLDSGDESVRQRSALAIIKTLGLDNIEPPSTTIEVEAIQSEQRAHERAKNDRQLFAEMGLG